MHRKARESFRRHVAVGIVARGQQSAIGECRLRRAADEVIGRRNQVAGGTPSEALHFDRARRE